MVLNPLEQIFALEDKVEIVHASSSLSKGRAFLYSNGKKE